MSSTALAQSAKPAELPVTRVVLFTNGVGYFEHQGTVDGDQVLTLDVPQDAMDDLLQSLVLQDFDGGTVKPVRYTAQDPLQRVLDGYRIDVSGNLTLAGVLLQARGASVTLVSGARTVTGSVVGVEQVQAPDEAPRSYVTLATSSGVVRVALDAFDEVRFTDEALKAQLDEALAAVADRAAEDGSKVRIAFEGEGRRSVRVGYLREMPVWKSTYRLVLGDDGRATLQGWAILDNPTNLALNDVEVAFVAGQPISFVTSLFEPRYLPRPRVETALAGNVVPRMDSGAFPPAVAAAPMAGASANLRGYAMEAAAPDLAGAGVSAAAEGSRGGATFSYLVRQPVSVGPFESAMVPIIVTDVAAKTVSVFDEATLADHPLRAVRLTNDTGLQLAAGTVTIYDAGGFAGTAQLSDLLPDDSRLLQYAVDLEIDTLRTSAATPERVVAVKLAGGRLTATVATRRTTTVRVNVKTDEPRFLVVSLPRLAGYEVVSPEPAPALTDAAYRFGVSVNGGEDSGTPTHLSCQGTDTCELTVVLERTEKRTTALADVDTGTLAFYLQNVELDAADRTTISRIAELQRLLSEKQRDLETLEANIETIHSEQERVRGNMAVLQADSPLYARYVGDLTAQEDDLAEILAQQSALRGEVRELRAQITDLIAGLGGSD